MENKTDEEKGEPININSRIKKIVIQLHNYSLFHGPSEIFNLDDRFVGRTELIAKLSTVLTRNKNKSGAYLVTGYRGMGKSSFVSQTISKISSCQNSVHDTERFIRVIIGIMLMLTIAFVIEKNCEPIWLNIFLMVSIFGSGISTWILRKSLNFKFLNIFNAIDTSIPHSLYYRIFQDVFLITLFSSLPVYLIKIFFYIFSFDRDAFDFVLSFEWSVVLFTILYLYIHRKKFKLNAIRDYFSYLHRVPVKINLGFESLREIDILKLVASNLLTQYHSFIRVTRRNWIWKLGKLMIAIIIVNVIMLIPEVNNYHKIANDKFLGWFMFPSQVDTSKLYENDSSKVLTDTLMKVDTSESSENVPIKKVELKKFITQFSTTDKKFEDFIHEKYEKSLYTYIEKYPDSKVLVFARQIGPVSRYLDFIIFQVYQKFISDAPFVRHLGIRINLNYLFLFMVFFFIWLSNFIVRARFVRFTTHRNVLDKLKKLNEQIDSSISLEKSVDLGKKEKFYHFTGKKSQSFPIADIREIEKKLIEIFEDMDNVPRHTVRPEFIFIFDELDKLEQKESNSENTNGENFEYDYSRKRQQRILNILANLKHFLTTAKAKFIFIAGRDLFDASLADVSDRDFKIGSIFNEIIYVDSFLKDESKNNSSEVTGLTEEYVCKFLFPDSYEIKDGKKNLKNYKTYLSTKKIDSIAIEKLMNELVNFITYLTYRSNGTPKKITSYFENFIFQYDKETMIDSNYLIVKNDKNMDGQLVLMFGYYDQYTFGVISYMTNPIFYSINNYIKAYGDKLLVSLAFTLDHIYKFHKVGFSLEDFETSPEIVDINRPPQIKELYLILLRFLSYTQIQVIDSGLYNFKFNKRISDEINFLCKVNEYESAAFNFTLDESLYIKRRYKLLLNELQLKYKEYSSNQTPDFIRSLSYMHMIMGDLHFYDEDYDQAILEYLDATQLYGDNKFENLSLELKLMLIKNTLKLGLAYEKRKSYDLALMTYGKLASRVIKFSQIFYNDVFDIKISNKNNISLNGDELKQLLDSDSEWDINLDRISFRFNLIEKMRLIYLPLLAKFQLLEKATSFGITFRDIEVIEKQFRLINHRIETKYLPIIEIEFNNHLGDILFFRNGHLTADKVCSQVYCNPTIHETSLCIKNNDQKKMLDLGHQLPCSACSQYMLGLHNFVNKYLDKVDENVLHNIVNLLSLIDRKSIVAKDEATIKTAANLFSDIGNTFLSCSSPKFHPINDKNFLIPFFEVIKCPDGYLKESKILLEKLSNHNLSKLEEALLYNYLAGSYYRRIMDYKEYGYQLVKILYILRNYFDTGSIGSDKQYNYSPKINAYVKREIIDGIKYLAQKAIRAYYRAYENSHEIELKELLQILEADSSTSYYNTISILWEIEEIVLIYRQLKCLLGGSTCEELNKTKANRQYRPIYGMYNRSIELEHFEEVQRNIFNSHFDNYKRSKKVNVDDSKLDVQTKIFWESYKSYIADSIFCLHNILKICKISGVSYDINHTFIANTYYHLGYWCDILDEIKETKPEGNINDKETKTKTNKEILLEVIKSSCGQNIESFLTLHYNYEMALKHYRLALDVHRNGRAYQEMIGDLVFLNDDFNDNFYHFCAALERFNINKGIIFSRIDEIKRKLSITDDNIYEGYDIEHHYEL